MSKPKSEKTDFHGHDRWLTFAFILGPTAALTNLFVSYSLVSESCVRGTKTMLHITAAAFFVACLIGAALSWRTANWYADSDLRDERARWLAISGTILCIASALIIVAMEIPNVILRSCE